MSSKISSVLEERCPQCRQGQMFTHAKYNIRHFDKMHNQCPECGLNFEVEPGFYTGAMYVSYAFSVAIFIIVGFFLFIFFSDPGILVYVMSTLLTIIVLFPVLFRYSRVIYLHLFGGISYNPALNRSEDKSPSNISSKITDDFTK